VVALLGAAFSQVAFLVMGFALGLTGQGIAISATTIIQEQTADAYRGRAFALYDMMFNGVFVVGALVGAAFVPVDGKSYPLVAVLVIGYLLAAAFYALLHGGRARNVAVPPEHQDPSPSVPAPGSRASSPGPGGGTDSPSASAHRSSS
jgi:MFS family permease